MQGEVYCPPCLVTDIRVRSEHIAKYITQQKAEIASLKDKLKQAQEEEKYSLDMIGDQRQEIADLQYYIEKAEGKISQRNTQIADLRGQVKRHEAQRVQSNAFDEIRRLFYEGNGSDKDFVGKLEVIIHAVERNTK